MPRAMVRRAPGSMDELTALLLGIEDRSPTLANTHDAYVHELGAVDISPVNATDSDWPSQARWIFVAGPPRDRPMAWSASVAVTVATASQHLPPGHSLGRGHDYEHVREVHVPYHGSYGIITHGGGHGDAGVGSF